MSENIKAKLYLTLFTFFYFGGAMIGLFITWGMIYVFLKGLVAVFG